MLFFLLKQNLEDLLPLVLKLFLKCSARLDVAIKGLCLMRQKFHMNCSLVSLLLLILFHWLAGILSYNAGAMQHAGLFNCWYTWLHCTRSSAQEGLWNGMWLVCGIRKTSFSHLFLTSWWIIWLLVYSILCCTYLCINGLNLVLFFILIRGRFIGLT